MTPVIILGGIYSGLMTPSETAAIAAVWAILAGFLIHRELRFATLIEALKQTVVITAVIFSIIAMATFLSVVLTYARIPQAIIDGFTGYGLSPMAFWASVAVICLILGTFVEIVPVFLSDRAGVGGDLPQPRAGYAASVRRVCRLCRHRHDYPAGLCRGVYRRRRAGRQSRPRFS